MEKNTKILVLVAILAFAAGGWYVYSLSDDASISYDYVWERHSYFKDSDGNTHYASSGNVYAYAYITEINTGHKEVLALPNCYTFVAEGVEYEWTTDTTDFTRIRQGETAHILTIYEIPSSVTKGSVVWNMYWIDAQLVDL